MTVFCSRAKEKLALVLIFIIYLIWDIAYFDERLLIRRLIESNNLLSTKLLMFYLKIRVPEAFYISSNSNRSY